MSNSRITLPGFPLPLGATLDKNGTQFSLFSRNATAVTLILFQSPDSGAPVEEIGFHPLINKTGDIWHIWVEGIREGRLYGYRIDGPFDPQKGMRFNRNKLLLDPFVRSVSGNFQWDLSDARGFDPDSPREDLSFSERDSAPGAPKGIVVNAGYDWYDRQINIPMQNTIIYELHVKGFTYHESSGCGHRGTFKGLTEKIPYLKSLGVTAVELMPIQEFDENENINVNPLTGEKLKNYWGYSTISFFAPRGRYCSAGSMGEQYYEFKEMVRDFHNAGIEVILDIVFNHTAEGDEKGPTMCFRGVDNSIYYMLKEDRRFYQNFSGCGNTFNCNHPLVRDFILDCLRYWVVEMHVDGFRFDLASILGRDQDGAIISNPPLLERIAEDPILRNAKIIAEAWDAGGAYQVGSFPGRWAEWNGKYRDDVRRFWKREKGSAASFATRLCGSSDLYGPKTGPLHGINFITCHDGFTLNDLVSYNEKHNLDNGENNLDGDSYNLSWNLGVEGPDAPEETERLRVRQIKNFIATLYLSQGIPMMTAGDEFRRTQRGNNNAYCQDNDISWVNWDYLDVHADIQRFSQLMIRLRKDHVMLRRKHFFTGTQAVGFSGPDISWHGPKPDEPDWGDDSGFVACLINGGYGTLENGIADNDFFMVFNASGQNTPVVLPPAPSGRPWKLVLDTSLDSGKDISAPGEEKTLGSLSYDVRQLSTVVFFSG